MNKFSAYALLAALAVLCVSAFGLAYGADREIKVAARGYCGPINMAVTIDSEDRIKDVRILKHDETYGVGARICEEPFLKQFRGKTADDVISGEGVDAITGATVSSRAVIEAVGNSVKEYLSRHPSELGEKQQVRQ